MEIYDTLRMARDTYAKDETYVKFCEDNNFLTQNGKPQLTAEVLYRFLTGDIEFKELMYQVELKNELDSLTVNEKHLSLLKNSSLSKAILFLPK